MKILTKDNVITKEESKELIELFCKDSLGVKHLSLDDCLTSRTMAKALSVIDEALNEYSEMIGLKRKLFYNTVAAIRQDANTDTSDTNSIHFDDSFSLDRGKLQVSPAIALLYLTSSNEDYYGGDLIFPFQEQIITPEAGRVVVFPTGYLHSHKVLQFFGGDRYLFRIISLFNTGLDPLDSKRLMDRMNLKQEAEKL